MEFSEAETSVLCKGLSFVPVSKNTGEFQVKAGCENFYRRLRLKAHFFMPIAKVSMKTIKTLLLSAMSRLQAGLPLRVNFLLSIITSISAGVRLAKLTSDRERPTLASPSLRNRH